MYDEKSLRRKLFLASTLSGLIKGISFSIVVVLVLQDRSNWHWPLIMIACVSLSIILDLCWFYIPSVSSHDKHKLAQLTEYDSAVDEALRDLGPYKMLTRGWFDRPIEEIIRDQSSK